VCLHKQTELRDLTRGSTALETRHESLGRLVRAQLELRIGTWTVTAFDLSATADHFVQ
jgi:hypothetical protein